MTGLQLGLIYNMAYISQYPVAQSATYVKSTSEFSPNSYEPFRATDPTKSLTGTWDLTNWLAIQTGGGNTNQRFHIDLGSAMVVTRIYYENSHTSGTTTNTGVKTFILQGSNEATAFADLTYATDTNWTAITTAQATFDQHTASDVADPKRILVTNTVAYRYYAFKFADDWGNTTYMGIRRIVLQTGSGGGSFLLNFV